MRLKFYCVFLLVTATLVGCHNLDEDRKARLDNGVGIRTDSLYTFDSEYAPFTIHLTDGVEIKELGTLLDKKQQLKMSECGWEVYHNDTAVVNIDHLQILGIGEHFDIDSYCDDMANNPMWNKVEPDLVPWYRFWDNKYVFYGQQEDSYYVRIVYYCEYAMLVFTYLTDNHFENEAVEKILANIDYPTYMYLDDTTVEILAALLGLLALMVYGLYDFFWNKKNK